MPSLLDLLSRVLVHATGHSGESYEHTEPACSRLLHIQLQSLLSEDRDVVRFIVLQSEFEDGNEPD